MHELGVVFYVVNDVKKAAEENKAEKVEQVTIQVGEVSGIIHEYLVDCWNWARKKHPILEDAEMVVETLEAITFCEDCEQTYSTVEHGKICPHCGSENTYLLRGNEFMIKDISIV